MAGRMPVDTPVLDEEMDAGTGLPRGLAGLAPFVDAAAAIAGAPGLAPQAPPAAVTP